MSHEQNAGHNHNKNVGYKKRQKILLKYGEIQTLWNANK
jgi:hypothetical protein